MTKNLNYNSFFSPQKRLMSFFLFFFGNVNSYLLKTVPQIQSKGSTGGSRAKSFIKVFFTHR